MVCPNNCTAIGKALLAGLTDEQVERLLPEHLPAETANTITDRAELLADLERVRASGVAYDREELTIGIPAPTARFGRQEERLAEMLLRTCAEVGVTLDANGHLRS
jgi:DNA-binding IclR family transcriptional regulator